MIDNEDNEEINNEGIFRTSNKETKNKQATLQKTLYLQHYRIIKSGTKVLGESETLTFRNNEILHH